MVDDGSVAVINSFARVVHRARDFASSSAEIGSTGVEREHSSFPNYISRISARKWQSERYFFPSNEIFFPPVFQNVNEIFRSIHFFGRWKSSVAKSLTALYAPSIRTFRYDPLLLTLLDIIQPCVYNRDTPVLSGSHQRYFHYVFKKPSLNTSLQSGVLTSNVLLFLPVRNPTMKCLLQHHVAVLLSLSSVVWSFSPNMIRSKVGIPLITTTTTTTTQLWAAESNGELNGSSSSSAQTKVQPKKVIVLGGDGFCGWPTSLHLSDQGHDVVVVDNLSRRNIDIELGCDSLTPIQSPEVGLFRHFL
jgi:hypothetical protein